MGSWEDMMKEYKAEAKRSKDALLPILKENGIKYAAISYNGYGDSGQVEQISVYSFDREDAPEDVYDGVCQIDIPKVNVTIDGRPNNLEEHLSQIGWAMAYNAHPGFENNEGGQGTVIIDVDASKVTINHGINYTQIEDSTVEF